MYVRTTVLYSFSPADHQLNFVLVAPRSYQKILSFSVGFFCVLGWQTSLAATCFVGTCSNFTLFYIAKLEVTRPLRSRLLP